MSRTIAFLSSLRLSAACLFACAVIVICGTFYQVDYGVYAAQERFFRSWFFFVAGFLPLPGLQTILSVALVNVLFAGIKRFSFRFEKIGLVFMHAGLVLLIAGAGLSSRFVKESTLTIGKNLIAAESVDLKRWGLFITLQGTEDDASWTSSVNCTLSTLKSGQHINFPSVHRTIIVKRIYKSCEARGRSANAIDSLVASPLAGTIPGLVLAYGDSTQRSNGNIDMLVYGGVGDEVKFLRLGDTITVSLLPERVQLPLQIRLKDFIVERHPGTTSMKKVQSRIHAKGEGIDREVVISMNRPFRYRSLTFYQTGFAEGDGPKSSTFTIVENPVRFLPHIASLIIVLGLLFHFCFRISIAITANRKKKNG
jgi:hypothetical protein